MDARPAVVQLVGARAEGVGTRIAVKTEVLGLSAFTDVLEVTLWQPPTRLVMAHRRPLQGVGEWRLDREGDRARFTWIEDVSLPIPLLGPIALAAYRPIVRRLMRRSVRGLQETLAEGGTPARLPAPRTIA